MSTNQRNPWLGSHVPSLLYYFSLYLLRRRWYYILAGLVLAVAFYIYRRDRLPMPTREYLATYLIRNDVPKLEAELRASGTYRPDWLMVNPLDADVVSSYFESTVAVIEAGELINYSVNYRAEGRDIYDSIPVDLRFVSTDRDIFDSWRMTMYPEADGVRLERLKGQYRKQTVYAQELFIPYDTETMTPVGLVLARPTGKPLDRYKRIEVSKMSDVETQDRYDAHLRRYRGGKLIELFLTANCTQQFADDLFAGMKVCYERYARERYSRNLRDYLAHISRAMEQIRSGHYTSDSLDLSGLQISETTTSGMLRELEQLATEARANATLLEQSTLLDPLDPVMIRATKQSDDVKPFFYLTILLIALVVPVLLGVVDVSVRRILLDAGYLRALWPDASHIGTLERVRTGNTAYEHSMDALRIRIEQARQERGQTTPIKVFATSSGQGSHTLAQELTKSYGRSTSPVGPPTIEVLPSLETTSQALEATQLEGTLPILIVRPGTARTSDIARLREHYAYLGIRPLIVFNQTMA